MNKVAGKPSLFFMTSLQREKKSDKGNRLVQSTTRAARKSPQAVLVESLYREHWDELCRALYKIYGAGPPEPEDVAQEAFTKLSRLNTMAHIENPKAFLFKVAFNISLKSIGRIAKTRAFIAEQLNVPLADIDEISPEKILEDKQRIDALQRGTEQLSEKQREILVRSRIKGETYAQISAEKGWSKADICRQLNAALALLEAADADVNT